MPLFAHGGTLDQCIGDRLMACFGAPVAQPDHRARAVQCTLAMHTAIEGLNGKRRARGEPALRMGIGTHTDTVMLGDIGSPQRREFTAVGDTVDIAARLEQLPKAQEGPILVSEATRLGTGDELHCTPVALVSLKGKSEPVQTHVPDTVRT